MLEIFLLTPFKRRRFKTIGVFLMLEPQRQLKSPARTPEPRKVSPKAPPLKIVWEIPPPDFEIPDEPMDDFDQSLLADALRDALSCAQRLSKNQLCATSLAVCVKVDGQTFTKAPDWFYVPYVYPTEENRHSYTPIAEGKLPTIVMEFLSDNKRKEYDDSNIPPYGKWYFYEQILKVPWYVIFNSESGKLEVYFLEGRYYKKQTKDQHGRYWIESLKLFLGIWKGEKEDVERKTFWLRWWDADGNRLPWRYEKAKQAEIEKQEALEKVETIAHETALKIAKQMLQAHSETAFIAQVTGLDEAEILVL